MVTALAYVVLALGNMDPSDCPMHKAHTAAATATSATAASPQPSPYVGEEKREVKALSEADLKAYLEGTGMGMAKPAELNQYPGPRHVLDLAVALKLSPAQQSLVDASFQRMKAAAVPLGKQVIDVERRLDGLFARREANPEAVARLTSDAADLQGRLRAVHLKAHVEVRDVLTPDQIEQYVALRGYGGHAGHSGH
jgi:hypothetical protein